MHFRDLKLVTPLLQAVEAAGYTQPSPIQQQAIPHALQGRDVLGIAQTGTGKTAAFALPILQRLSAACAAEPTASTSSITMHSASMRTMDDPEPPARFRRLAPRATSPREAKGRDARGTAAHPGGPRRPIRALVLAPTRELATQIGESFRAYGRRTSLRTVVVFGGVSQGNQVRELKAGADVLVACPGRLLDLIGQGHVRLDAVEVFVLDEADRMLDMGFVPDIRRVLAHLPARRQTLLFSATMPEEIQKLADDLLRDPVRVEVARVSAPAERVDHAVYFVGRGDKISLLRHLLAPEGAGLPGACGHRVLVFTRTRRGADRVALRLTRSGVRAESIHGDKSQGARERALRNFRHGTSPVLVATDLAARGLDVDGISHVVNFDLPNEPETFVHRIGRTGRAGASGFAVSFCDAEEAEFLAGIEALIQKRLPQVETHPHHCETARSSHRTHEAKRQEKATGRAAGPASHGKNGKPGHRVHQTHHASSAPRTRGGSVSQSPRRRRKPRPQPVG